MPYVMALKIYSALILMGLSSMKSEINALIVAALLIGAVLGASAMRLFSVVFL